MTDYQPLSCDLHDELEIAALRQRLVQLYWRTPDGDSHSARGLIRAIDASGGEEYLRFEVEGDIQRIRLDWLEWRNFPLR